MSRLDQLEGKIWINGEFVDTKTSSVHTLTHTLHYGSGVFEGIRCYNNKPFKLTEHNQRLLNSAEILGMDVKFTLEELNKATMELVKLNGNPNCYIRPFVWYGSNNLGVGAKDIEVHCAIACWEWNQYYDNAIRLNISRWKRPSPETAPVHAKAAGLYMIATMTKTDAEKAGYNDGLMLDYRGYIAEVSSANIFFIIKDGSVITPIADCFLNGITRQTVIELIKEEGIKITEKHILPEEIKDTIGCFVTGTAAEIVEVSEISGNKEVPSMLYQKNNLVVNLKNQYKQLALK